MQDRMIPRFCTRAGCVCVCVRMGGAIPVLQKSSGSQ